MLLQYLLKTENIHGSISSIRDVLILHKKIEYIILLMIIIIDYQYQGLKVFANNKRSVYLHMVGSIVGVSLLTIAESMLNDQFW